MKMGLSGSKRIKVVGFIRVRRGIEGFLLSQRICIERKGRFTLISSKWPGFWSVE